MRNVCCAAALLLLATSLRAEVVARSISGTVVAFEAPSGDNQGRMVARHTYRLCGKLVNDDYHFVFAKHLCQGKLDPSFDKNERAKATKKQYPHFPKDVKPGVEIGVYTDPKPANGKVWTARALKVK